jgi:hypothetical protein
VRTGWYWKICQEISVPLVNLQKNATLQGQKAASINTVESTSSPVLNVKGTRS